VQANKQEIFVKVSDEQRADLQKLDEKASEAWRL
jgi:hypothetical protein